MEEHRPERRLDRVCVQPLTITRSAPAAGQAAASASENTIASPARSSPAESGHYTGGDNDGHAPCDLKSTSPACLLSHHKQ
jgi:hypothetical protein